MDIIVLSRSLASKEDFQIRSTCTQKTIYESNKFVYTLVFESDSALVCVRANDAGCNVAMLQCLTLRPYYLAQDIVHLFYALTCTFTNVT
jgi:hypothetical protein